MGPGKFTYSLIGLCFLHLVVADWKSTICRVQAYYPGEGFFRRVTNITVIPPEKEARSYAVCCPGLVYNTTASPDCDRECPKGSCIYGYCPPDDDAVNCKCYDDEFYPGDSEVDCIPTCHANEDSDCTCHDGYTKDERTNHCVPTECFDRCTNGECDELGVCTCQEGYVKHANKTGRCVTQKCHEECQRGTCDATGSCVCDDGFKHVDDMTCERIDCPSTNAEDTLFCKSQCDSNCKYGTCTDAGTCNCQTGFKRSSENIFTCTKIACPSPDAEDTEFCKAECDAKCDNYGECTADGVCDCIKGYHTTPEDPYTCQVIVCPTSDSDKAGYCKEQCETQCNHGVCSDGGQCVCNLGYKSTPDDQTTCTEIVCPSSEEDDVKFCKSDCESKCVSGKCSADGSCSCFAGYRKSAEDRLACNKISCPAADAVDNEFCKGKCELICADGSCSDEGRCSCAAGE